MRVLALVTLSLIILWTESYGQDDLSMTFEQFRAKYQKPAISSEQYLRKELIFYENIKNLRQLLANGCDYCGVTKFYDETKQQFRNRMGLKMETNKFFDNSTNVEVSYDLQQKQNPILVQASSGQQGSSWLKVSQDDDKDIPSSLNWKQKGKITSIKNQGDCGTCWSFACVAAIESSMIMKGQSPLSFIYEPDLSEQFLLTCAKYGSCDGGYLEEVIDLAYKAGVPYEVDSPYRQREGSKSLCSQDLDKVFYTKSKTARFSFYNATDQKMIQMLQDGPIMISISADNWENYGGGTFRCRYNAQINHAVLLVGYDGKSWYIKNQWGANWGQDGYIRITRDKNYNCRIGSSVHKLFGSRLTVIVGTAIIFMAMIFMF